ncbi:hypothetical protein [Streptomyces sp. NBC_00425]
MTVDNALHHCPDAAKLAGPWRDLGRDDLTSEVWAMGNLANHDS